MSEDLKIRTRIYELVLEVLPFGYLDLQRCAEVLVESGVDSSEFGRYVVEYCNDLDIQLPDVDVCYLAYEYILQEVRLEIQDRVGVDILNDLECEVYTYGNYCCSSYDCKDYEPTMEVIQRIREEDRSRMLDWFLEQIE